MNQGNARDSKRTARQLQEALDYAEDIISTMREPLLVLDGGLRIVSANRSFYREFSTTPEENEGKLIYEVANGQWNIPKLRELLEHILPQNTSFENCEVDYDFPDLGRRTMLLNAGRIDHDRAKTQRILLAIEDITERKRMEQEMAFSELRYRRLFETAEDGILILDAESGEITDVNPFLLELLGYSIQDLKGRKLWEIGFLKDANASRQALQKLQDEGHIRFDNLPLETSDGQDVQVEFVSNLYSVKGDKVIQCNIRDVTGHRKAEAAEQARRKEALYQVSHGIAGPIELEPLATLALKEALRATGLDAGVIRYLDGPTRELAFLGSQGFPPELETAIRAAAGRLKLGQGLAGEAAMGKGPIVVSDIGADNRCFVPDLGRYGFISAAYMPLLANDEVVGVISGYSRQRHTFTPGDMDLITNLGTMLGMAMANARLFEQVQSGNLDWRQTFDAMTDGVALISPEHTILRVNWALARMLGTTPNELVGKPYHDAVHGCREPIEDCPVSRCMAERRACELVRREPQLGNRWLHLRADPVLDPQGQVVRAVQTIRDVSDEIAHHAVKEERKTLEAIIASMGEGLAVVNAGQKTIYLNGAAEALLGINASDVVGKPVDIYYALIDARMEGSSSSRNIVSEALCNTKKGKPKFTFRVKEPVHREIEGTMFVIEREGQMLGSGAVLRDVTREHELDRMKSEFIYIASHELRTPMTSVYGFAELLLMRATGLTEDQRHWVETIYNEGKRLSDIVEDLLDVSRIEAGGLTLRLDQMDLGSLLTEVIDQLRLGHDTHTFNARVAEGLLPLRGDKDKLRQVLSNLVDNAIKYSPQGGLIEIRVKLEEGKQAVVMSVSDHGLGIPVQDMPKLFTRFHRVARPETIGIRGTGLGLYIVKSLVEMMEGNIWVESELMKGSTFYFTLPLNRQAPE